MKEPQVDFAALPAADGSVSYRHEGYAILASVNGPLEVQRRDEIPDEVFLEVNVREASGTGGPRERKLESDIQAAIRPLVLLTAYPRALIQLTLQVVRTPAHAVSVDVHSQHSSTIPLMPHLINAAVCALLDGNIAMAQVAVATSIREPASQAEGEGVEHVPRHMFVFNGHSQLLVAESDGSCSLQSWQQLASTALKLCCGDQGTAKPGGLLHWLRTTVANELQATHRWQSSPA